MSSNSGAGCGLSVAPEVRPTVQVRGITVAIDVWSFAVK